MRARGGRVHSSPRSPAFLGFALLVLVWTGSSLAAPSDNFDIGSGGQPTLTGSLGGRVVFGDPNLLTDLSVTIDLGEISPINRNGVIRVEVPIAIRSNRDYQVEVSVTSGGTGTTPEAPQLADVGFGLQNVQLMGKGKRCAVASHRIAAPFNSDPALAVDLTGGRARYPSSLASVGTRAVVLQGPELSAGNIKPRVSDNGWRFDAVFALVPQFFAPGTSWVTITFHISQAPINLACL